MNRKNKITSDGYGIVLFSKEVLKNKLSEQNIKSKNLLNLFDENYEFAKEIMYSGTFLPLITASFNDYYFEIYNKKASFFKESEWLKVKNSEWFNLKITEDELWIASISSLANWNYKKYKTNESVLGYEVMDGVGGDMSFIYEAQKIFVESGIYNVSIEAFKRKMELEKREENYGLNFKLVKVNNLIPLDEVSKDNTFDID